MENKNLETAVYVVVGLIVVPMVIGAVSQLCSVVYCGVTNLWNQREFEKQMGQRIKEGTVVKIDGHYYEVEIEKA